MVKLIAIIRGVHSDHIIPVVKGLLSEGINDIEVSLSEEEMGLECIRRLSAQFKSSELNLGVGTIINTRQADLALTAGAQYVIMPGWDENLVKYLQSIQVEVIPGVFSPAEVMRAVNLKIKLVKLFPADFLGPAYIKSLEGPFPGMEYLAVGGVNLNSALGFLKGGFKGLGLGNCLVPRGATTESVMQICNNAKSFKELVRDFEQEQ
jgi:2-dehydro-3-deoxyphosphogluconate aldolase / (4S)-4-hydroxy-2-oxoglutarate aldolase